MAVLPGKEVKNRNSGDDYQSTHQRIPQIVGEGVAEEYRRGGNKECGHDRISPNLIGAGGVGDTAAEDKDSAARDHVKEPLRKDSQRKQLAKTAADQEQKASQNTLNHN